MGEIHREQRISTQTSFYRAPTGNPKR
jgi:hypothetical protein